MKAKTTRRALLMSVLSLLLCVSMLFGTTFAWFTDSVTSGRNTIQAGNLDVVLEYWDGDSYEEVTSTTKLFDDAALWEPGYTEVAYLKVSNAGSLALKYQLAVNVYSETDGKTKDGASITLSDYLQFKVIESDTDLADTYTRETAKNANATATKLQTYNSNIKALDAKNEAGDNNYYDYVALIIYMPESVTNEANHDGVKVPSIQMGVNLLATQQTAESDSFDNQYDAGAEILVVDKSAAIVNNNGTLGEAVVLTADMIYGTIEVTVPAGAQLSSADVSSLKLTVKNTESGYNGQLAANQVATGYEIYVDGVADYINPFVNASGRTIYNYSDIKVELPIGVGRNDVKVYKDGMMPSNTWASYDSATGVVTFSADYFTPFSQAKKSNITVVYTELSKAEKQLNEVLENATAGDSVTINSTADNMVSVNNIADALKGSSNIALVGNGADNTTVTANSATITANGLTVKDMTIQSVGTTTINGNNTAIEGVTYQSVGASYGLTISGSDTTIKNATVEGANATQGLVLIASGSDTTASVTNVSGLTITDISPFGSSSGFVFKNMNGTTNLTNSTIKVKGTAVSFGPSNSTVRGYANVSNSTLDSTGIYISTVKASTFDTVTFDNTWYDSAISFTAGGTTNTFTNCEFKADVDFQSANYANKNVTLTFNNCTYNGVTITAENIKDHFVFDNGTFGLQNRDNLTVIVDGVTVTL